MDRYPEGADRGQFLRLLSHGPGSGRAVDAEGKKRIFGKGCDHRPEILPAEHAAALVAERDAYHDRNRLPGQAHGALAPLDGRLGHQGIKDRLDQKQVDTALQQRRSLLFIDLDERVEVTATPGRVIDIGGERQALLCRTDIAGDKGVPPSSRLRGNPAGGEIQVAYPLFQSILAKTDPVGVEGVGLDDVGPRVEVGLMDVPDYIGPVQVEKLPAALLRLSCRRTKEGLGRQVRPLEQRPHGPVQQQDPLLAQLLQRHGHPSSRTRTTSGKSCFLRESTPGRKKRWGDTRS